MRLEREFALIFESLFCQYDVARLRLEVAQKGIRSLGRELNTSAASQSENDLNSES